MVMTLKQISESCEKMVIKKEQSNMVKLNELLDKLNLLECKEIKGIIVIFFDIFYTVLLSFIPLIFSQTTSISLSVFRF